MTTYHIIEAGDPYTAPRAYSHSLDKAKAYLEEMRARTGKGYYIAQVEVVHTVEPMTDEEIEAARED